MSADRTLQDVGSSRTAAAPQAAGGAPVSTSISAPASRAWRIALVAYLVPITVLTHWPRFGIGGAGAVDKFVHFVAFGALAWIAMHAAPRGRAFFVEQIPRRRR